MRNLCWNTHQSENNPGVTGFGIKHKNIHIFPEFRIAWCVSAFKFPIWFPSVLSRVQSWWIWEALTEQGLCLLQVPGPVPFPCGEKRPRQEVLQHFISLTATSELKWVEIKFKKYFFFVLHFINWCYLWLCSLFPDPGNPSLYKVGTTLGTSGRWNIYLVYNSFS